MSEPTETAAPDDALEASAAVAHAVRRIDAELAVAMARAEKVASECARLLEAPSDAVIAALPRLAAMLASRHGPAVEPLAQLLERLAETEGAAAACALALLGARDPGVADRGIALVEREVRAARLSARDLDPARLAAALDDPGSPWTDRERLGRLAGALRATPEPGAPDPLLGAVVELGDPAARTWVARLLDLAGEPADPAIAARMLGDECHAVLSPYLEYTRAGYLDLVHLVPFPGAPCPAAAAIRAAVDTHGARTVREIVSSAGWPRIALGFEVHRRIGVDVGGGPPWMVEESEAALLESCGARRVEEAVVVYAHGGLPISPPSREGSTQDEPIVRFRGANLAHAEALELLLAVTPPTLERVSRLVALLDGVVADFLAVFERFAPQECEVLPEVWGDLRARIVREIDAGVPGVPISAELTRLVFPFEDPAGLGSVRCLHGLKRHLHQRGLALGFRLVEAGGAVRRAVEVGVIRAREPLRWVAAVRYADFEPAAEGSPSAEPYAVRLVAEAFAAQALHGQRSFPGVRAYLYGNEVHYYVSYGSHPAFVRVDLAPPLRGGMVDLEYYGVRRVELEAHPNRELDAIREIFRHLAFDVEVADTRVHARYDKERARDLGDLCAHIEALFRLAPYLMDLDWVLADVHLPREVRTAAARAWAERFATWGVLPLDSLLTADRLGIVAAVERDAAGERELRWDGIEPYRDRFGGTPSAEILTRLARRLEELGVVDAQVPEPRAAGAVAIERLVLGPLRRAAARGEIVASAQGLRRGAAPRVHEAEAFARLLAGPDEAVMAAAALARVPAALERTLSFRATGSVQGHVVERVAVPLHGAALDLAVLRGPRGMARLALHLADRDGRWSADRAEIARLLRAAGYALEGPAPAGPEPADEPSAIRERFAVPNPFAALPIASGEAVVAAVPASPGRAAGRAVLGVGPRRPADVAGAVLFAAELRPEDAPFLHRCAAVVSTGGGILSHAGIIATQYHRAAVIVNATWGTSPGGAPELRVPIAEYAEDVEQVEGFRVAKRRDVRERTVTVREGDLVVVDADRGALQLLGHDAEVVALHEALSALGSTAERMAAAAEAHERLAARGESLRARHRIESAIARLADPVAARYAVHEIVLAPALARACSPGERGRLLAAMLAQPDVGPTCRDMLVHLGREVARRHREASDEAARWIPVSETPHEALWFRLGALKLRTLRSEIAACLHECGLAAPVDPDFGTSDLDRPVRRRLDELREGLIAELERIGSANSTDPATRHRVRAFDRIEEALRTDDAPSPDPSAVAQARRAVTERDRESSRKHAGARVLRGREGGFDTTFAVGRKAAHLGEIARLAGERLVPAWFAVTDAAFREVLACPLRDEDRTLGEAIEELASRRELDLRSRAAAIRALWDGVRLPDELIEDVTLAYGGLHEAGESDTYVAVRSSAIEEDTEHGERAGEFDTFLFVRGGDGVLAHLRRAWAGLWGERALYARAVAGDRADSGGGGVIVQRMVRSRVSGVLQTVHVAASDPREIVIDAGLGLGEGVVSGTVAADRILVAREGDLEHGPLHCRYITADKREQVVLSPRGAGTIREETRYHQRLRPALEYFELLDLVGCAVRLERAFGQPLDIEWAIEGDRLRLLQVRPIAAAEGVVLETRERFPLPAAEPPAEHSESTEVTG